MLCVVGEGERQREIMSMSTMNDIDGEHGSSLGGRKEGYMRRVFLRGFLRWFWEVCDMT